MTGNSSVALITGGKVFTDDPCVKKQVNVVADREPRFGMFGAGLTISAEISRHTRYFGFIGGVQFFLPAEIDFLNIFSLNK